jgi:mRNA-degrading endonuclease RelE of RelBE toxin-antitoxin system
MISDSALSLLKKLPEPDRKSIARKIEALGASSPTDSIPLTGDPHLRMTRAGDYRLVYKVEKSEPSLLILSIFRPEDNEKIEELLKKYLVAHPPVELTELFQNASVHRVRDLWVESDENSQNGRRIVGTGTVEVTGTIGPTLQKEDVDFSFEALLDRSGSLSAVKRMDLDVYATD